jgi:hypothetical protein
MDIDRDSVTFDRRGFVAGEQAGVFITGTLRGVEDDGNLVIVYPLQE